MVTTNLDIGQHIGQPTHKRWILESRQDTGALQLHFRVLDKLRAETVVGQASISYQALANMNLDPAAIMKLIYACLDSGMTLTEAVNVLVDERAPWRTIKPEEQTVENIFNSLKEEVENGD